ncbi:hypothetical protein Tco_1005337 [Tanacetum coccineum]|uniref:Uncharacterized protein n=1 Tax=Tanacetum coccineum TaxID=301880 RepID=A0ABQ5FFN5_9ASTR
MARPYRYPGVIRGTSGTRVGRELVPPSPHRPRSGSSFDQDSGTNPGESAVGDAAVRYQAMVGDRSGPKYGSQRWWKPRGQVWDSSG